MNVSRWVYIVGGMGALAALLWAVRKRVSVPDYPDHPAGPYGPYWRDRLPRGAPPDLRHCSPRGYAEPYVRQLAADVAGERFAAAVVRLAENESGLMFGRPANRFAIQAGWGVFQWNTLASEHHGLPMPWELDALSEIQLPIERAYAPVWRRAKAAGAPDIYAERALRLWQIAPAHVNRFLKAGSVAGDWALAWRQVDYVPRGTTEKATAIVDRKLRGVA